MRKLAITAVLALAMPSGSLANDGAPKGPTGLLSAGDLIGLTSQGGKLPDAGNRRPTQRYVIPEAGGRLVSGAQYRRWLAGGRGK